jgi:histidinol-phosphate aminotransferase
MTLSRRAFAQLLGTGAAAAAFTPRLAYSAPRAGTARPNGFVRLNANENPYGPSPAAIAAMRDAFGMAARYPDDEVDNLTGDVAKLHGVGTDGVIIGAGSSEILKLAAAAFTSPARKLVMAAPTFESIGRYSSVAGAEVVNVPLDASYAHDLAKMAAVADAGVIYICNPNNPTATITPAAAIRSFLASVNPSTVVLVDEAYHHYVTSPNYESVVPLIATRPNLIVARTFSKIYAMAGLRAGYAVGQPEIIRKLDAQKAYDSMSLMALVAARASLADTSHVVEGRRRNTATKHDLVARLAKQGYTVLPSEANFLMIDLRREVKPVIGALRERKVQVGRVFPAMPKHLRVTIGTPEEMDKFMEAFSATMSG